MDKLKKTVYFYFVVVIVLFFFILAKNELTKINSSITDELIYTIKNDDLVKFRELYSKYNTKIYEIRNNKNQNIIHLICLNSSVNILKEIVDKVDNKYLMEYDNSGNYPLKYAIIKDNVEIVRILVKKVDKEQRDKFLGFTPFLVAAFSNKLEILKILYENNCNINAIDLQFENNALFWATRKYNLEIIKYLVNELKMDYNHKDSEGSTIFFEACSSFIKDKQKCFETLEYLYSLNNNFINMPNDEGIYPIMIAIYNYNLLPLTFIITKNKNLIFSKDKENQNILDYLILTDNEEAIKNVIKILKAYYLKEDLIKLLNDSKSFNLIKTNLLKNEERTTVKKYINIILSEIYN
jgi:ankyrin repeat protein